jgi:citrate synthase
VVDDKTSISNVVPETNSLTYRGYPVQDLASSCSFEQVAYLIWHGELPTRAELESFMEAERNERDLSASTTEILNLLPSSCHPMDSLRTVVSCLGAEDPSEGDNSTDANQRKALSMMAKLPTALAREARRRRGFRPIPPAPDLGFAENFLQMTFGEPPDPEIARCFEISLILYAEHSFNASTFTARVVASTLSDIYSAVTAAIGALRGQLHGGANEAVMEMMLEIGDPDQVETWLREALAEKKKIMGFGHRVYRDGDSRVPTMKSALERVVAVRGGDQWLQMYDRLERGMEESKGIKPNLDFPAGPAY